MTEKLSVEDRIEINASKEKVWEVLTNPDLIKQWDDIPENYPGGHLELGSTIEWEGYSRLTVTQFDRHNFLSLAMYLPQVDLPAGAYDVRYNYTLTEKDGKTSLSIAIGDFSQLPKANDYYDATLEWVQTAGQKIKELAEK
ncbi:SRPBCC family protein [Algoriphagus terrigena]|uniref:SRPBCC family protein n=1 Tax=Algoriphagus terrigena TaxID=344884 RepID=UPI0004086AE4|nr:SRPBCC domain-containing protein [Algoriphagus terrigena]